MKMHGNLIFRKAECHYQMVYQYLSRYCQSLITPMINIHVASNVV